MHFFSSDGVRIAHIDLAPTGEDRGDPILLIHGFASNHTVNWVNTLWTKTLMHDGRRVIALDNRGHGQSEKLYEPAKYSTSLMARDAVNLLDHLGDRARGRDGLFDGRAHHRLHGAGAPRAGAARDPRRAWRPARQGGGAAQQHRRGDGGRVARRSDRSDAAHVPRLRRIRRRATCGRSPPASAATARASPPRARRPSHAPPSSPSERRTRSPATARLSPGSSRMARRSISPGAIITLR